MFTSAAIIVISTLLFGYWFRYTCRLILTTRTSQDFTRGVAAANHLTFQEVHAELSKPSANLEQLVGSLERDYRLMCYLLEHTAHAEIAGVSLEQMMLRLDYSGMRLWFSMSRRFSDFAAREALNEMSQIIGHFANSFGERLTNTSAG